MKNIMEHVLKTCLFLIAGIIGGYLLLVAVFALPISRIQNHVSESSAAFSGEYKTLIYGNIATMTDDYTDALMLLTAGNNYDSNPFSGAIYDYRITRKTSDETTLDPDEIISDTKNPNNENTQYSRYWHGYLLFLKPLLLFLNYSQILALVSFTVIGLIVAVVYLLEKKKLSKYIIPYALTMAVIFPIAISLSIQYISVFAILNLALIVILAFYKKIKKTKNFFYVFLTIGMLTCYFDLLTYPVVTLGIPLLVWLLLLNQKKALSFIENCKQIGLGSLAWLLGYFGIWVGKWALGSLITGENLFTSALQAASDRSSSNTFLDEISRFFPIGEAFNQISTKALFIVLILITILIIALLAFKKIKISKQKAIDNLWMLIIALIPLVWYLVLANHSTIHIFFTYRTLSILIFAVGCYITSTIEKERKIITKGAKLENG